MYRPLDTTSAFDLAPDGETVLPRRLLGIWPHPDDEAYLSAGLMARVIDAGGEVTVLTLTRGEKGTGDPDDFDQPHFAARREVELRASLAEVGVSDLRFGGFRDGECELVADHEAVAAVASVISDVGPDLVVTFGPDGITGHPDHRITSRWVTAAWRWVGGFDLRYATWTAGRAARFAPLHARIGLFGEFGLDGAVTCADRDAWGIELTEAELDRKRRALAGHASQTTGLAELLGEATYRDWVRDEHFRRPTPAEAAVRLTSGDGTRAGRAAVR